MKSEQNNDRHNVSEMEISDVKQTSSTPKYNRGDRIKSFFLFFTVELSLLCYVLSNSISYMTTQQFHMRKACRVDLGRNDSLCDKVAETDLSDNEINTTHVEAQKLVSNMYAWSQPLQYGIPAIIILFIGAWSDRTGNRKIIVILPIIGELVSTIGLILATYYFSEWPLWVTGIVESLPTAFSGGLSVAVMGSYSYIADVTSNESRTFRMGLLGLIVSLAMPVGTSLGGILTKKIGYYGVYSTTSALYLIGILYTFFRIKDVRRNKTEGKLGKRFIDFFHPRNVWDTISILFKSRANLLQVLLVILAHIVILGPVFGESSVLYFYTTHKFGMEIVEFSLYQTYHTLMTIGGTAATVTIFCKLLKLHDAVLGLIGTSCKVLSSLMYGLAPTKLWFYSGPALDFFGGGGALAIRSLGTKLVGQEDTGKFCSILGLVEGLTPVIYLPLYNKMYYNTVETMPGAIYIVGAAMTVPAIFIFIYLYIVYRKSQKDFVKNPEEKEMHAHENAVTIL